MNTAMHVRVVGGIQNDNVYIFVTEKNDESMLTAHTNLLRVFI